MNQESARQFKENGYCIVQHALDKRLAAVSSLYTLFEGENKNIDNDEETYSDALTESLLANLKVVVEDHIGLQVLPTYSQYKVYYDGEEVDPVKNEKLSSEVSAIVCLGYDYDEALYHWDIKLNDKRIELYPGDMLIYRGNDFSYSRPFFKPRVEFFESLAFLNYVYKDGNNASLLYDGREFLGFKP
jgi:hypothetical protein